MNRAMSFFTMMVLVAVVPGLVSAQTTNKTATAKKAGTEAASVPATVPASKTTLKLAGGADFRIRDEMKDKMPGTGVTAKKYENMVRVRSRVWGSASFDDYTLFGRMGDEFRMYTARSPKVREGVKTYDFPDEAYIDNLYFAAKNLLWDKVDLRVGRQELKYGEGRIISDGSPGDGSRSAYFDAVKGSYHVTDKTTLDAFGIYMDDYDRLAMGPYDRALETCNGYEDNEDSGAGLYLTVNEMKEFPFEMYYVWENESHAYTVNKVPYGRDFHTFGTRVMPKFSPRWSGEIEAAVQTGETDDGRDIFAYMGYGGVTYAMAPDTSYKPYVTPAIYYLSGDKDATKGDDNNWNPVFNRTTWFSVLTADQYKNYAWSNLIFPHLAGGITVLGNQKIKAYTGPLFTVADDQGGANGASDDTYKGYLSFVRYEAPLVKGFLGKNSDLNHAVQLELFAPGDYYETDDIATFFRYEVNLKF